MYIEVTNEEFAILQKGLELWEGEPTRSGLMGSMLGAMFRPPDEPREEFLAREKRAMDESVNEVNKRKLQVARLRVKFLEAMERPSEFSRT
jgi:hypothetical protein